MTICKTTYLVALPQQIVALDLALTIQDHTPFAQVIVTPTLDEAALAVEEMEQQLVAFVAAEPEAYHNSRLAQLLRLRKAKVVLIGDGAERCGPTPEWDVLETPFSSETVGQYLVAC